MPLSKWQIKPGFDKQNSEVGAVARYVGGDNVRFRYTLPEKVGGWKAEGGESISSVSRRLHPFRGNDGNQYLAIGTDKFLLIYYEDNFYDITPYRTSGFPLTIDEFKNSTFSTIDGSNVVTITTQSINGLSAGDIVEFENVNLPTVNVSTTLSQAIDASQTYIPVADTTGFITTVAPLITSTNEFFDFTDISENRLSNTTTWTGGGWQAPLRQTRTANAGIAPDGTNTAFSLVPDASNNTHRQDISPADNGGTLTNSQYTVSIFGKADGYSGLSITLCNSSNEPIATRSATFDLTTGTVAVVGTDIDSASIQSVGNDWYRCIATITTPAVLPLDRVLFGIGQNGNTFTFVGNTTDGILAWGPQIERGGSVSTYFPNTTATPKFALTGVTRGVNGSTAQPALLGATVTQTGSPYNASGS